MAPRTVSRRVDMHGDVHNPPKAKRLGELVDAIESWDKLHEKYQEMGGQEVVPDEQCVIILRMLPSDTPPSLVMSLQGITDVTTLKETIERQVEFLEEHKGSHGKVQMVEDEQAQGPEPSVQEESDDTVLDLTGLDADTQIEILMAAKTGGFRGKIKTTTRGPAPGQRPNGRPSTPPRTQTPGVVRPNRCGNCGGEHSTRDCPQPMLEPDKRACFNCGGLAADLQPDLPGDAPRTWLRRETRSSTPSW
jgi:hypothetical protein